MPDRSKIWILFHFKFHYFSHKCPEKKHSVDFPNTKHSRTKIKIAYVSLIKVILANLKYYVIQIFLANNFFTLFKINRALGYLNLN